MCIATFIKSSGVDGLLEGRVLSFIRQESSLPPHKKIRMASAQNQFFISHLGNLFIKVFVNCVHAWGPLIRSLKLICFISTFQGVERS